MPELVYKEEIRDNIVITAARVFGKYGFRKTTMDEIAKASKKGKSTIYYYFTSKEEVFRSVVEKEAQFLRSKLISVISEDLIPQLKLKKYIYTRISTFQGLVNYYDAIKDDYLNNLPFIEEIREKYDKEEIVLIKMVIIEGIEKSVFDIDDIQNAAETLWLILKGLEYPLIFNNVKIQDVEQRIDKILNMVFKGILRK